LRRVLIYALVIIVMVVAGTVAGVNFIKTPKDPGGEGLEETPPPSEPMLETSSQTPVSQEEQPDQPSEVMVTLDNYDWSQGVPSWEVLNETAESLTRIHVELLYGAISAGLFDPGPYSPLNKTLIEENLSMKLRLNATVYPTRFILLYRDGGFYTLGSNDPNIDRYLRAVMIDCIMAKKAGLAVHLAASFIPESGFESVSELRQALDDWDHIVKRLAALAEEYRFEFFNPNGELDHFLRVDSGLKLSEAEVIDLFNEYSSKYAATTKAVFTGETVTQLGDAHPVFRESLLSYNLSCMDLVGILTGAKTSLFDADQFQSDLLETAGIMKDLCQEWDNRWYISEVWFYEDKPVTGEKLEQQSLCFEVLFDTLRQMNPEAYGGPVGVLVMDWNLREEQIFADVINRPAEQVIQEFFSSHTARPEAELGVAVYPGAEPTWLPDDLWADMGVSMEASPQAFMVDAAFEEVSTWYREQMVEWEVIDEGSFSDPEQGVAVFYRLLKSGEDGVYIVVLKDQNIPGGKIMIGVSSGPWDLLQGSKPSMLAGLSPSEGGEGLTYSEFYDLPGLGEGPVVLGTCPLEASAFSEVEPLGNLNPEGGHTFPSDHSGLMFVDTSRFYEVRAPADGVIVEIEYRVQTWPPDSGRSGTYDDFKVVIAHSKTFMTFLDHLSEIDESILDVTEPLEVGFNRVEVPIEEGQIIGRTGGRPKAQHGLDWGVFDKNVSHYINPERYSRYAHVESFIPYCQEELKTTLLSKVKRTAEPRIGQFDYDELGKLVGNWFLEGVDPKDPLGDWEKHISFVYYNMDPSSLRIGVGGTLPIRKGAYAVKGNSPDPAEVTVETGMIVFYLDTPPEYGIDRLPQATLIVEMVEPDRIRVEAFEGWIENPEFTENALYYTR